MSNAAKEQIFKIGEFSERVGVPVDTLRYYEKLGLLKAESRSSAGYRLYGEQNLVAMNFILNAKELGFSLSTIQELLSIQINKKANSCEDVKTFTAQQLKEVDERLEQLQSIRKAIADLHDSCCGGPEDARYCSIIQALEGEVQHG